MEKTIKGNTPIRYNKEKTKNPIARFLYKRYKYNLISLFPDENIKDVLEIGCGRGEILNYIDSKIKCNLLGVDIEEDIIKDASRLYQTINFKVEDGQALSFKDDSFDLVLVLEVLEHVKNVDIIIAEAKRVSKKYCIFSVPREPLWKILNIARGAHLSRFGNTPGHINHWSSRGFEKLLSRHFVIIDISKTIPWTIISCEIK